MNRYIIEQANVAALIRVREEGTLRGWDVFYMSDKRLPEAYAHTDPGMKRDVFLSLPLEVRAAVNRDFGVTFSLAHDTGDDSPRSVHVRSCIPYTVEVEVLNREASTLIWFATSSGRIELQLKESDAYTGSHQGSCDDDIAWLRKLPYIAKQLAALDPALLAAELKEYGAWDTAELADHDANLSRILWLACGDICEELASKPEASEE